MYIRLNCPCCGNLVHIHRVDGNRAYEPYAYRVEPKGYAKIEYKKVRNLLEIDDFWLKRLKRVTSYLQNRIKRYTNTRGGERI